MSLNRIKATTEKMQRRSAREALVNERAERLLTEIDEDLALMAGGATNAELIGIMRRVVRRQQLMIRYIRRLR